MLSSLKEQEDAKPAGAEKLAAAQGLWDDHGVYILRKCYSFS